MRRLGDIGNSNFVVSIKTGPPMTKNSTPSSITAIPDTVGMTKQGPAKITIAKIRQFARAYSFLPVEIPSIGGVIAN